MEITLEGHRLYAAVLSHSDHVVEAETKQRRFQPSNWPTICCRLAARSPQAKTFHAGGR